MQRQESETFMNIPMIIFLFILIAGGLLGLEIYRELHHFRITHYTIESQKFKGFSRDLNLIFLSDLHNRVYGEKNEPLLQAIRNEKPDLILIGGDMLVGKEDASYDIALDFTSQLPEIAPVLYATGNHEQRMRENPEIYQASWELVSKIQTMRKEAGFEVMDHIYVYADNNDTITGIIKKYADQLKSEVLADSITLGQMAGHAKEWNINGETVMLGVAKVTR